MSENDVAARRAPAMSAASSGGISPSWAGWGTTILGIIVLITVAIFVVVLALGGAVFSGAMMLNEESVGIDYTRHDTSGGVSKLCDPLDPTCGDGHPNCQPNC